MNDDIKFRTFITIILGIVLSAAFVLRLAFALEAGGVGAVTASSRQGPTSPHAVCSELSRAYAAGQGGATEEEVGELLRDLTASVWGLEPEHADLADLIIGLDHAWRNHDYAGIDLYAGLLADYCYPLLDARKAA